MTTLFGTKNVALVMAALLAASTVGAAFAASSNDNSSSNDNNSSGSSSSNDAKLYFQQGVATSMHDPLPGHYSHQLIMILPPRNDSKIYSGVLTFVATQKVEVVVLHVMHNETAIPQQYGQPLSALVPPDNKTMVAISLITPNYGTTPAPSYSIPFAGNAIALHTLSGKPFSSAYSVSYQIGTPKIVNDINATAASSNSTTPGTGSGHQSIPSGK